MELTELQYKILNNRLQEKDDRFSIEDYVYTPLKKIFKTLQPNLTDLDNAAKLVVKHMKKDDPIILAVDIDCDGISSGAMGYYCFSNLFEKLTCELKLIISSRNFKRGFNSDLVKKLDIFFQDFNKIIKREYDNSALIITADMGSYDNLTYKEIKEKYPNVNIIVTDHHEIPDDNYPTYANYLINPQRKDNTFGKKLCGCGVLFMLLLKTAHYYFENDEFNNFESILPELSPFVAIATIVDMMSMKDIFNRFLIKTGIMYGNELDRNYANYKSLLNIPGDITFKDCSSLIGPLINTANRTSSEEFCLAALTSDNDKNSMKFLTYINDLNKVRKKTTEECLNQFLSSYDFKYTNSYVGLINTKLFIGGSVASAVSGMYLKPSVIFQNTSRDIISGSARSGIDGLDILTIFKSLPKDIVVDAAGHKSACGVSIYKNKLEEFRELFDKQVELILKDLILPTYEPEISLTQDELTLDKALEIMQVGPYGVDFQEPILTTTTPLVVKELFPIRSFYKITFIKEDKSEVVGMHFFKTNSKFNINSINIRDMIKPGMKVQVLFTLGINYYKKDPEAQLEIIDIIPIFGEQL